MDEWYKDPFQILMFYFGGAVITLTIIIAAMSMAASNKIENCYIQAVPNNSLPFGLYGNIDWRPDFSMGSFASVDAAVDAAAKMKCRMGEGI